MNRKPFGIMVLAAALLGGATPLMLSGGRADAAPCNYRNKVGVSSCSDCWGVGTGASCVVTKAHCRASGTCGSGIDEGDGSGGDGSGGDGSGGDGSGGDGSGAGY